jgi:Sulfotransferase family
MPFVATPKYVFVGGLHRSGTTLLGRALAEHPLVSGFADTGVPADEGQHLQSVYPPAREYGGPGLFAFAPEAHLTESSPLVSAASRERLLADWAPHWDTAKQVLVEKSPPNLIRMRFLQALFPEAAFVAVLRHPVAVAYATAKWRHQESLRTLLRHWVVAHELYREDRREIARLHEVRFEDFVRDPDAELARLEAFLGLDPAPTTEEIRTDANEQYFARWRREGRTLRGRIPQARIRRELGARVEAFGYDLDLK